MNKAIHVIANTRMRTDSATQAYVLRRRAQGKSDREIRRCIKRYITRQLYRALTTAMNSNTAASARTSHTGSHDRSKHPANRL